MHNDMLETEQRHRAGKAVACLGLGLVLAFSVAFPALAAPPALHGTDPFTARVARVYDGDSMVVMWSGRKVEVRLWGIDAPERGQPFADRARARLKSWEGVQVRVEPVDRDRYQRVVAWVKPLEGGPSLNEVMCREGLAWWYQRFAPRAWSLARAMLEAVEARKGLWSRPEPIPPWQWRRSRARD